jgi:hypothetical protein
MQSAMILEGLERLQSGLYAMDFHHCHSSIEGNDGRIIHFDQLIVVIKNFRPVDRLG